MPKQKPASVTIIVILQILDGLWGLMSGCALLAGGGILAAILAALGEEVPHWVSGVAGGVFAVIGLVLVIFALLDFVLAWGIGSLYRWAWWVTLVKAILSILGPLLTLINGNLTSLPTLAFNAIIIALLLTADVRQAMDVNL